MSVLSLMNGFTPGIVRVHSPAAVEGNAGTVYNICQPPAGEIWCLRQMSAYHDGIAAYNMAWNFIDDVTNLDLCAVTSTAANAYRHLITDVPLAGPLTLTNTSYMRVYVTGLTAGHYLYIRCLVNKLRGIGVWNNS